MLTDLDGASLGTNAGEEEQTPPGEEKKPDEAGSEPEKKEGEEKTPEPPADPLTLEVDVDGTTLKVSDLVDLAKNVKEDAPIYALGEEYAAVRGMIIQSPETAKDAIQALIDGANAIHGSKVDLSDLDFGLLDPSTMTTREAKLYALATQQREAIRTLNNTLNRTKEDSKKAIEELKPMVEKAHVNEAISAAVQFISTEYGKQVTPAQIRTMMEQTGLDDPVKAYKAGAFDDVVKSAPSGQQKPSSVPMAQVNDRTFDPRDPNLTVDEMIRLQQRGFTPRQAAKAS